MNLQQVKDFLNGVKDGSKAKIIEILEKDQQMVGQIIQFLMTHQNNELAELVYSSLFTLYQNGGDLQKAFVLHFLPALVWEYLFISSNHGQKGYGKLEAVLLAIYNAEVVDEDGKTKYQKFRLPSLSRPSLYHEPSLAKSGTSALTESALSRHEQSEVVYRLDGPGQKLTRIPACHRFAVIAFVLEHYNHYIAFMGEASLDAACKMALLTASCGFKDLCMKIDGDKDLEKLSECSRIPLDNATLVQLVYIIYYALYNGFSKPARRSFEALHFRAEYGLFSQAYLLTRSIEHLLESQDDDIAPLGLDMSRLSDCSVQSLPKCLDVKSTPWKRRCPYELLLADKPVPSVLELDETLFTSKLKLPKDSRPKKAKSWTNISSGKPSPVVSSAKSPGSLDTTDSSNTPTLPRVEHFEMVTGV